MDRFWKGEGWDSFWKGEGWDSFWKGGGRQRDMDTYTVSKILEGSRMEEPPSLCPSRKTTTISAREAFIVGGGDTVTNRGGTTRGRGTRRQTWVGASLINS